MTHDQNTKDDYHGAVSRAVYGVCGLGLAALGFYAMLEGVVAPLYRITAGALMAWLGINALWCAWHGKPSWLARLVLFL